MMLPSEDWLNELDALAAAPENHKLLFENESVRVLDTRINPGETTPLHVHCWPAALYILSWSDFIRRDENGSIALDSRSMPAALFGAALWTPPLAPHTVENVGTSELRVIAVELKRNK
jgi:hypothetical protein